MLTRVFSAAIQGIDALEVEIEVNTGAGEPKIVVVGLPDTAVKESKDRVTTAIANSAFRWPRERTTINLAPADIKKEGPSFDLPIAIGMVAAALRVELPRLERCLVVGELALTGEIRPVKGALPIALEARNRGKKAVVLPSANAPEAAIVEGIDVYGVRNLREAYEFLSKQKDLLPVPGNAAARNPAARNPEWVSELVIEFFIAGKPFFACLSQQLASVMVEPNTPCNKRAGSFGRRWRCRRCAGRRW